MKLAGDCGNFKGPEHGDERRTDENDGLSGTFSEGLPNVVIIPQATLRPAEAILAREREKRQADVLRAKDGARARSNGTTPAEARAKRLFQVGGEARAMSDARAVKDRQAHGPRFELRSNMRVVAEPARPRDPPAGSVDLRSLRYPPSAVEEWGKGVRTSDRITTINATHDEVVEFMAAAIAECLRDFDDDLSKTIDGLDAKVAALQHENEGLRREITLLGQCLGARATKAAPKAKAKPKSPDARGLPRLCSGSAGETQAPKRDRRGAGAMKMLTEDFGRVLAGSRAPWPPRVLARGDHEHGPAGRPRPSPPPGKGMVPPARRVSKLAADPQPGGKR